MAFTKKTWVDRISEFPNRRGLTNTTTGISDIYDVTREEGNISQQGDAFSATNMNDLEDRIEEAVSHEVLNMTLLTSGWVSGLYTISDPRVTADSVQIVTPSQSITATQLAAYQGCGLTDYSQTNGEFTLKAMYGQPSIDIPIRVIF